MIITIIKTVIFITIKFIVLILSYYLDYLIALLDSCDFHKNFQSDFLGPSVWNGTVVPVECLHM